MMLQNDLALRISMPLHKLRKSIGLSGFWHDGLMQIYAGFLLTFFQPTGEFFVQGYDLHKM